MTSGLKSFVIQYPHGRGLLLAYARRTLWPDDRRGGLYSRPRAAGRRVQGRRSGLPRWPRAGGLQTVAEICDGYIAEAKAGRIGGRRRRAIKASTLVMDRSRIESHIKPLLGKRQIAPLKLGDIEGAQADIAAGKTSKARVVAVAAPPPAAKVSPRGRCRHSTRSSSTPCAWDKSRPTPPRACASGERAPRAAT